MTFLKKASGFCHTLKAVLILFSVFYLECLQFLKEIFAYFKGINYFTIKILSGDLDGIGLPYYLLFTI